MPRESKNEEVERMSDAQRESTKNVKVQLIMLVHDIKVQMVHAQCMKGKYNTRVTPSLSPTPQHA